MIGSKIMATAIVAFSLSSSALACVNFKGTMGDRVAITDGDIETCSGDLDTGGNDSGMFTDSTIFGFFNSTNSKRRLYFRLFPEL